ncbi:hypothetical protein FIV00_23305 [Labrenzia sp. THAF82]|nr:hypothetical protein FIV00_23305 [Labrenzia sp. THAF82]
MSKELDSFVRKELRKNVILIVVVIAVLIFAGYRLL